jgi:hypothetical protein
VVERFDRAAHPFHGDESVSVSRRFSTPSFFIFFCQAFFESMYRDPINFLSQHMAEVRGTKGVWTFAVTSGLSVRLWEGAGGGGGPGSDLLWHDQTRSEVVSPPADGVKRQHASESRYIVALGSSGKGGSGGPIESDRVDESLTATIYSPAG